MQRRERERSQASRCCSKWESSGKRRFDGIAQSQYRFFVEAVLALP